MRPLFWAICLCVIATGGLAEPQLRLSGIFDWDIRTSWFGGWSGIEMSQDGADMLAISDRGHLVRARLIRNRGLLEKVTVVESMPMRASGVTITDDKPFDAEGLAIDASGHAYVSFEFNHRLERVDVRSGRLDSGVSIPFDLKINGGVEALAVHADGTLYGFPEMKPAKGAPFEVYRFRDGTWDVAAELTYRRPFLPVGADFDDRGRLWLLERAVTLLGFRSRIRMITMNGTDLSEITLLTTRSGQFDNLEGLSVWRDTDGKLRVTAISDDNFLRVQGTQIVDFTVEE